MWHFFLLFCFAASLSRSVAYRENVVRTYTGDLEGLLLDSDTGNNDLTPVLGFFGVNYGRDTKLTGLFSPPKPVLFHKGIKKATEKAKSCYGSLDYTFSDFRGSDRWNTRTEMSTDCLNMNIWVPHEGKGHLMAEKYPVMVWIFGGGYKTGSASLDLYDGRILASKQKVIVIAINYRLGPFGFAAFDFSFQPETTGNVGLKDQTLALKWIHQNIIAFGGDAKRISLFGESAGGAAVNYHLLKNGHLLNGVIMQSGVLLCPWASEPRRTVSQISKGMATELGCYNRMRPQRNTTKILDCMSRKDPREIMKAAHEAEKKQKEFSAGGTVPVHERFSPDPLTIPDRFYKNFAAQIPVMIGSNRDEGSFLMPYWFSKHFKFDPDHPEIVPELSYENYYRVVEKMMGRFYGSPSDLFAIAMKYTHFPGRDGKRSYRDAAIALFGDFFMTCPIQKAVDVLRKQGKTVYQYVYSHNDDGNPWPKWMGVLHGEEIPAVFGTSFASGGKELYSDRDREVSNRVMSYWAAFAKYGSPSASNFRWLNYGINNITGEGERYSHYIPTHCQMFLSLDNAPGCKKVPYNWVCEHEITTESKRANPRQVTPSPSTLPPVKSTISKSTTETTTRTTTEGQQNVRTRTSSSVKSIPKLTKVATDSTVRETPTTSKMVTQRINENLATNYVTEKSTTMLETERITPKLATEPPVTKSSTGKTSETIIAATKALKIVTEAPIDPVNSTVGKISDMNSTDGDLAANSTFSREVNENSFKLSATIKKENANRTETRSVSETDEKGKTEIQKGDTIPEAGASLKESDSKNAAKPWTETHVVKSSIRLSCSLQILFFINIFMLYSLK